MLTRITPVLARSRTAAAPTRRSSAPRCPPGRRPRCPAAIRPGASVSVSASSCGRSTAARSARPPGPRHRRWPRRSAAGSRRSSRRAAPGRRRRGCRTVVIPPVMSHPFEFLGHPIVPVHRPAWEVPAHQTGGRACRYRPQTGLLSDVRTHAASPRRSVMGSWIFWLIAAAALGRGRDSDDDARARADRCGRRSPPRDRRGRRRLPAAQLGAFAAVSVAGLGLIRPIAMRHISSHRCCAPGRRAGRPTRSGRRGRHARTTDGSGSAARYGRRGLMTRPRSSPRAPPSTSCEIEGATALVHPRE